MPITLYNILKSKIVLEDNPIATPGNEGSVHKIIGNTAYSNYCAKIYHPLKRTPSKRKKVEFMINNKPTVLQTTNYIICWPTELLFDFSGKFMGFIMPLAYSDSIKLYELATTKMNTKLLLLWGKFDRTTKGGIERRLKICVNIAISLHAIHQNNKYVLVDYKPQNILITKEGKISITDVDSFQISDNGKVLYPAEVATPEYVPPEATRLNPATSFIPDSWDRFSFAVSFYELLLGIHPYAATCDGQYHNATTIGEKIQKGLFVHGSKKNYLNVIPPLHSNFQNLPISIRSLFVKAFEVGHTNPDLRPTAEMWGQTIVLELNSGMNVKPNSVTITGVPKIPANPKTNNRPIPQPNPTKTRSIAKQSDYSGIITVIIIILAVIIIALAVTTKNSSQTYSTKPMTEPITNYPYTTPAVDTMNAVLDTTALAYTPDTLALPKTSYIDRNGRFVYLSPCYIIVTGAFLFEQDAKNFIDEEKIKGYYNSGYLWIPDYASLSGKRNYATFIGPYETRSDCESSLKSLTPTGVFWYGKKVTTDYYSDEIRLETDVNADYKDDYDMTPARVVEYFFNALNNQDCDKAWNISQSPTWDAKGKDWFCSYEAFGTINKLTIQEGYVVSQNNAEAIVYVYYYSEDNYNGNFWFKQNVILNKMTQSNGNARWMVVRLKNIEPPISASSN